MQYALAICALVLVTIRPFVMANRMSLELPSSEEHAAWMKKATQGSRQLLGSGGSETATRNGGCGKVLAKNTGMEVEVTNTGKIISFVDNNADGEGVMCTKDMCVGDGESMMLIQGKCNSGIITTVDFTLLLGSLTNESDYLRFWCPSLDQTISLSCFDPVGVTVVTSGPVANIALNCCTYGTVDCTINCRTTPKKAMPMINGNNRHRALIDTVSEWIQFAEEMGGNINDRFQVFPSVFSSVQCKTLVEFTDRILSETPQRGLFQDNEDYSPDTDFMFRVTNTELSQLLGDEARTNLATAMQMFEPDHVMVEAYLRRSVGPNVYLPMHHDKITRGNIQVILSSLIVSGGELEFITNQGLVQVPPVEGEAIAHQGSIVHGVAHFEGIRYSLIIPTMSHADGYSEVIAVTNVATVA